MSTSALVVGSTGAVGRQVLSSLLSESAVYTRVYELGRRKTTYPVNGVETPSESNLSKLVSLIVDDNTAFEDVATLKSTLPAGQTCSSVFLALGTSRAAAGSAQAFEKIDREYVVNAAKAAKTDSQQRLVYCSSGGANPNSAFPYLRSKGQTEQDLAALGYSETIIFRPGLLRVTNGRDTPRIVERMAGVFTHMLSWVSANAEIETKLLGRAMRLAGELGIQQCLARGFGEKVKLGRQQEEALIIYNADAVKLALAND